MYDGTLAGQFYTTHRRTFTPSLVPVGYKESRWQLYGRVCCHRNTRISAYLLFLTPRSKDCLVRVRCFWKELKTAHRPHPHRGPSMQVKVARAGTVD